MPSRDEIAFYTENAGTYNCYAFALSAKDGTYGHPGSVSGSDLKSLTPNAIDESLRSDGLIPAAHEFGEIPSARDGYYLIAAVAAGPTTSGVKDYHFYRQMDDGSWWHDPGKLPPTDLDAEGNAITNPQTAARDYTRGTMEANPDRSSGYDNGKSNYNLFVGYYYVPDSGLAVAPGGMPVEQLENKEMRQDRLWQENLASAKPIQASTTTYATTPAPLLMPVPP